MATKIATILFQEPESGATISTAATTGKTSLKSQKDEQEGIEEDENCTSTTKSNQENKRNRVDSGFGKEYDNESDLKDNLNSEKNDKFTEKKESGTDSKESNNELTQRGTEFNYLPSPLFDLDDEAKEELANLSMMLHSSAPFAPHHHPHHHARAGSATGGVGGVQTYGVVNSAFHRQPSSGSFHHGHHQVRFS